MKHPKLSDSLREDKGVLVAEQLTDWVVWFQKHNTHEPRIVWDAMQVLAKQLNELANVWKYG